MLGKHQRRAAVADGEIALVERPGALAELLLQRAVLHLVHEIERPRPDLRFLGQRPILRSGGEGGRQGQERERGRSESGSTWVAPRMKHCDGPIYHGACDGCVFGHAK